MNLVDFETARQVCKIGHGKECCRYLGCGSKGLECFKVLPVLKEYIDQKVTEGTFNAEGDNCNGMGVLAVVRVSNG